MAIIMKNIIRIAVRVTIIFLLIISLLFGIIVGMVKLMGYKNYSIVSDSMYPVIQKGDMIFVKPIEPEMIKVGNIITFTLTNTNIVVTHRVSRIEAEEQQLYTIGDGNNGEDPDPVLFANIIGIYAFKIPGLGKISLD